MAFLPTNASQVQQFAIAAYGIQVGSATMTQVQADITALGGLNNALNAYYSASFGSKTTASVAATVAANLGLTGQAATDGAAYITSALNAAPASARGAVIAGVLNLFAGLTADATYGAAASAWNTKVETALSTISVTDIVVVAGAAAVAAPFNLLATVDNFNGSGANDTFVADNTGTDVTSAADILNGGAGTDTLKVFLGTGDTAISMPTLTGVENLFVNGGAVTALTAPTGTTSLQIESPVALTNATYTLSGQAVTLTSALTASGPTAMTTTLANAATTTAATVNLQGYTYSGTDTHVLAVTGTALTTLNLSSTVAANKVASLTNASAALTTLNITGDKALTLTDTLVGLKTYNASATTGGVTINVNGKTPSTTFSFTGGSGRDILTVGADAAGPKSTWTMNGGDGATDKLAIKDVNTTANTAGINKAVGFEYLGLASGTANSTYDMSLITAMSIVNVDTSTGSTPTTAATAASGTAGTAGTAGILLTGLSNANSVIIDAAITSGGGTAGANTTSAVAGAVGGAGAVGLTLTPNVDTGSNTIALTLNGVTIDSSGGVGGACATGTTSAQAGGAGGAGAVAISATSYESVSIVSNFATDGTTTNVLKATGGAGAAVVSSSLAGAAGADAAGLALGSNATLTITGAAALNAGLVSGTNVTVNASALTGNLTMSTGTGNDVITGGSGVNTITLTGGIDTLNLAASTAKADVIAVSSGTNTSSTNFVKIASFTNAATTGDKLDTAIASITIQADVAAGTATGVTNLTGTVVNGILSFAGTAAPTATLANKVTAATAAAFAGTVGEVLAFEHGGNTYVFAQVGTADAFNAGTDQLIELTGVTGLTSLSGSASSATALFIA